MKNFCLWKIQQKMIKVKYINVFISNQKIKIKTKKTYIKMIILNKMKILFRNRKNKS